MRGGHRLRDNCQYRQGSGNSASRNTTLCPTAARVKSPCHEGAEPIAPSALRLGSFDAERVEGVCGSTKTDIKRSGKRREGAVRARTRLVISLSGASKEQRTGRAGQSPAVCAGKLHPTTQGAARCLDSSAVHVLGAEEKSNR